MGPTNKMDEFLGFRYHETSFFFNNQKCLSCYASWFVVRGDLMPVQFRLCLELSAAIAALVAVPAHFVTIHTALHRVVLGFEVID